MSILTNKFRDKVRKRKYTSTLKPIFESERELPNFRDEKRNSVTDVLSLLNKDDEL